jgi:KamA family protein
MGDITKKQFEEIDNLYPVKISAYLQKQIKKSKYIANQFLPSVCELQKDILITEPFKGLLETHINSFERLYEDRVLLKLTSICPAHCRFCYRRGYVFGNEKTINDSDLSKSIDIVKKDKNIRSVLLTGGFPLVIGKKKIENIIEEFTKIDHIKQIYIALGRPIMSPSMITVDFADMLVKFNNRNKMKNIACTVHINHPDELTKEVVRALNIMTSRGITVWTQTTLLKGINDKGETMSLLMQLFRNINLIPYYLIHAMPMIGTSHFRTTVEKGIKIMQYLEQFSGHERPIYIVLPSVGKVQLIGNSKLNYKTIDGKKYVILKSPYKMKDFLKRNKIKELPEKHFSDKDGYISAYYLDGRD